MNALSVFLWLAIILTSKERKKITTTSAKLLLMFLTRGSVKEKKVSPLRPSEKKRNKKTNFTTPWHQNQFSGETVCRLCVNFLVFTVSLRNESCGQELRFNYYVCSKISMDTEVVMLGMIVLQKIYPRRLSVLHAYRLIAVL